MSQSPAAVDQIWIETGKIKLEKMKISTMINNDHPDFGLIQINSI